MSVKFYDKGEHGAGFIGFRVAVDLGANRKVRQRYFSLNNYSYADAYTFAHELEQEWIHEAKQLKEQDRLDAKDIRVGPVVDSIKKLAEVVLEAEAAGIKSTKQLSTFLLCAKQEGNCLYDILNFPLDSPEYKSSYGTVRQLMLGAANRGFNGANLLTWGEIVYGQERAVLLTPGGYRLFSKIKNKLDLN